MARKLLLADDSITIQKVVELVLAEEGFEIKAVSNGEDALAVVPTFKPEIVLADIEMPKMNGYQLCEKIKTNPATKNVPVILLSGAFEPLDEELARQVKADSFVIKPFESQELIGKINASLMPQAAVEVPIEAEAEETMIAEAVGAEDDLWAMEAVEESSAEAAVEEVQAEVEAMAEEFGISEAELETAEAEEIGLAGAFEAVEEAAAEEVIEEAIAAPFPIIGEKVVGMPGTSLPSKEEMSSIFKKAVDERVASFLSTLDIKNVLLSSIAPSLKDSVEKILWEVTPDLTEKLAKEILQSSLASLSKEVEKVIWETVPEIAETMVTKEIEKIRAEM